MAAPPEKRKCLLCDYNGDMYTWCDTSWLPNLIIVVGLHGGGGNVRYAKRSGKTFRSENKRG